MKVRFAKPEDMSAILRHAKAVATTFVVEEEAFSESYAHLIESESSAILVAEVDNHVVGYCLGHENYTFFANGKVSWLEEIFVLEEHRKTGLGRKLVQAFEEWAKGRGSKLIALATRRAASFYRAIGFEESAVYFRKLL